MKRVNYIKFILEFYVKLMNNLGLGRGDKIIFIYIYLR